MIISRLHQPMASQILKLVLVLSLSTMTAPADEPVTIGQTPDGRSVVSFSSNALHAKGSPTAIFNFGLTKGFLGPSSNPADQKGFRNRDTSIVAVNHQPATKCSHVHLFLRSPDGDLIFLNNVNERVARLLERRWQPAATDFLRVESLTGRSLALETVDFSGQTRTRHRFTVAVSANGTLTLSNGRDQ